MKYKKHIWQGALNWMKQLQPWFSFQLSFKRDVAIVWKNGEGIQKMRIKVISLVATDRIKGFSRDSSCAVINQRQVLVRLYAQAEGWAERCRPR